jgi:hypothetical protein
VRTLIQHINATAKVTPGSAVWAMDVTSCVDVRSGLVDRCVNDETRRIDGSICASDTQPLLVYVHHT